MSDELLARNRAAWAAMKSRSAVEYGHPVDIRKFQSTGRPGKSGTSNGFSDGRRYDSGLPSRPGVYVLMGDRGVPVYVGVSRDIRRRVKQHWYPHVNVLFHPCELREAEWAEVDLVAKHNPEFNTKLRVNLGRNKRERPPAIVWIPRAALEAI